MYVVSCAISIFESRFTGGEVLRDEGLLDVAAGKKSQCAIHMAFEGEWIPWGCKDVLFNFSEYAKSRFACDTTLSPLGPGGINEK